MSNEINIEELERLAKELIGSVPGTASYRDLSIVFTVTMSPDGVLSLIDRLKKAESELERERMRLAACGVVALADTPESAAQAREMRDEYRSASCDDVARRVDECMTLRAERDALAAKLKEQDAWIDDLLAICHRLALELECLLLDTKDLATVSRWWDSAMAALDGWHKAKDAASVRPVPAEPVNARLVEALKRLSFCAQTTGGVAGRDDELCSAIEASAKAIAAAEAQQERLLQDMHDAGREVDRVMAEPQPDAGLIGVQWWLAELDLYGNPALADGAHSDRAGADKAMHLFKALHLDAGRRFAVARVELSEPKPRGDGVNHEAIKTLNDARREAQP